MTRMLRRRHRRRRYLKIECEAHSAKTQVRPKSLRPVWKEVLKLAPVEDVDSSVTVSVFDHDKVGADDLIGSVEVPLKLLRNKCPVRRWLPLGGSLPDEELERIVSIDTTKRGNERKRRAEREADVAGVAREKTSRHLVAESSDSSSAEEDGEEDVDEPSADGLVYHKASPLEYADYRTGAVQFGVVDVWFAWRHNPDFYYQLPRVLEQDSRPLASANEVTIRVIRAKRLLALDRAIAGAASSDPMVSLKLPPGDHVKETKVAKRSLFPHWGQTFTFTALDATDSTALEATVYDVDEGSSSFLGRCSVPRRPSRNLAGGLDFAMYFKRTTQVVQRCKDEQERCSYGREIGSSFAGTREAVPRMPAARGSTILRVERQARQVRPRPRRAGVVRRVPP